MFPLPAGLLLLGEPPSWESTEFSEWSYEHRHSTNDFLCFAAFPYAPPLIYKTLLYCKVSMTLKQVIKEQNISWAPIYQLLCFIMLKAWDKHYHHHHACFPDKDTETWEESDFHRATWRVSSSVRIWDQGFLSQIQALLHKATLAFHTTLLRLRVQCFRELSWGHCTGIHLSQSVKWASAIDWATDSKNHYHLQFPEAGKNQALSIKAWSSKYSWWFQASWEKYFSMYKWKQLNNIIMLI